MTFEEIQNSVASLSTIEQTILLNILTDTLKLKHLEVKRKLLSEKVKKYALTMHKLTGINVLEQRRDSEYVWGRNIIIFQLLDEGFTLWSIGKVMGKDHSTIAYIKKQKQTITSNPAYYPKEIELMNKFKNAIR